MHTLIDKLKHILLHEFIRKSHQFLNGLQIKSVIGDIDEMHKILIVSLDYIGDYCMRTIPTIYLVKKVFPSAEISVLAGAWSNELVKTNPAVKMVEIYNPAWLDRSKKKWGLLKKVVTLFGLKKNRYDLIIDVRGSIGISLWYLLHPARYVVCLQNFIKMQPKFFPEEPIKMWKDVQKETEKEKKEFIAIPEKVKYNAKKLLTAEGVDLRKRVVSIHPSVYSKVKRWLPDRWAVVIDNLVNIYNIEVLICGDGTAREYADCIINQMKFKAHNLVGKTTLMQLIALIQMSNLCISIDSGPMHIAGLLDVPVVGLFGPNNPKTCHPLTAKCRLIFKDLPCADCIENIMGCNTECMEAITCGDVMRAVTDLNNELNCLK